MNSLFLSEADFSRLHHIYHNESLPPLPSPPQRREIGRILAAAEVPADPALLESHVGFGDEVVLSSPSDDNDDFVIRVVTPSDADPSNDRISILMPVSLAIVGRAKGSAAAWEANGNLREMKIASIRKPVAEIHSQP